MEPINIPTNGPNPVSPTPVKVLLPSATGTGSISVRGICCTELSLSFLSDPKNASNVDVYFKTPSGNIYKIFQDEDRVVFANARSRFGREDLSSLGTDSIELARCTLKICDNRVALPRGHFASGISEILIVDSQSDQIQGNSELPNCTLAIEFSNAVKGSFKPNDFDSDIRQQLANSFCDLALVTAMGANRRSEFTKAERVLHTVGELINEHGVILSPENSLNFRVQQGHAALGLGKLSEGLEHFEAATSQLFEEGRYDDYAALLVHEASLLLMQKFPDQGIECLNRVEAIKDLITEPEILEEAATLRNPRAKVEAELLHEQAALYADVSPEVMEDPSSARIIDALAQNMDSLSRGSKWPEVRSGLEAIVARCEEEGIPDQTISRALLLQVGALSTFETRAYLLERAKEIGARVQPPDPLLSSEIMLSEADSCFQLAIDFSKIHSQHRHDPSAVVAKLREYAATAAPDSEFYRRAAPALAIDDPEQRDAEFGKIVTELCDSALTHATRSRQSLQTLQSADADRVERSVSNLLLRIALLRD